MNPVYALPVFKADRPKAPAQDQDTSPSEYEPPTQDEMEARYEEMWRVTQELSR